MQFCSSYLGGVNKPSQDEAVFPQKRKPRPLTSLGLVLTAAYLLGVFLYWRTGVDDLLALQPNAFGDFLAGTFAPLAFLWLVLGFLQQGDELRYSADALWLQSKELQNSVEQQRELVKVTREELELQSAVLREQRDELARNAQPILKLTAGMNMGSGEEGSRLYEFPMINFGRPCTDVSLFIGESGKPISRKAVLGTGDRIDFRLKLPVNETESFTVVARYLDSRLIQGTRSFTISRANSKFVIVENE